MRDDGFDCFDKDDWPDDNGTFGDNLIGEDDIQEDEDDFLGFLADDFAAGTGFLTDWFGL